MAAPIPRPMTHGSAKVPWEAKKPAASKTVSPGTGTPALSRKTPRNTIAYPYRARRFASSTGIVGVRELTRRQIEAGRRLQIRALGEQPRPRRARHALGFGDDRGLVQGQHAPVAHEPAPVHHHGFDVAGLALVHEARDGAQRGREVRAAEVDDDEVGAIARRQPAAVGNTERAIAVARGPRQRLLRRRLTAVGAAHALHEHRRAHDLHHVLGHVVGAERDETARALELVDARGEPGADAAAAATVPPRVELSDAREAGLGQRRVSLERTRLADRRPPAVPRALAEHEPEARIRQRLRVALELGALL